MAKAAAKAAAKKPNSFYVIKGGKKIYGAPALAIAAKRAGLDKVGHKSNTAAKSKNTTKKKRNLDHRDAEHPIEVSRYFQGRPGYMTQWQRAHHAGQQQLFKMNPGQKLSPYTQAGQRLFNRLFDMGINPDGSAKSVQDFVEFQGREPDEKIKLDVPDGTPNHTSVCGPIPKIELLDGRTLQFNQGEGERPILLRRGHHLYIAPGGFRWSQPGDIGLIKRIHYITRKDHINDGELIQYHHKFGEEGGAPPMLAADHECMFTIVGGSYTITGDGIRD